MSLSRPTEHVEGPHGPDTAAIARGLPAAAVGLAFATAILAGALRPVAGNHVLLLPAVAWPLIAVAGAPLLGVRPRRTSAIAYAALLLGPVSAAAPGLALPWFLRQQHDRDRGGAPVSTDRVRVLGRETSVGVVWAAPIAVLLLVFAAPRGFAVPVHWALSPALAYVMQHSRRTRPGAAWSIAIAGLAVSPWGMALVAVVVYFPMVLIGVWFASRRLYAGTLDLRGVRTAVAGAALFTVLCEWTGGSVPGP